MTRLSDEQLQEVLTGLRQVGNHCCRRDAALALLQESAPIYRGRGSSEVERLRAYVLVGLGRAGLGDALLPYIREELETGRSAFGVAAAARAARHLPRLSPDLIETCMRASARIRLIDDIVDLDHYPADMTAGRSASDELAQTLAAAHCCGGAPAAPVAEEQPPRSLADIADTILENQDGIRARLADIFSGRPGLIVFFYTRCTNPDKCSRSISNLARVAELIARRSAAAGRGDAVRLAGLSYDPDYDLPVRLRQYGETRGMAFSPQCQLLRAVDGFAHIADRLALGVGYGSSTVNRHRIELLSIDRAGRIAEVSLRRLWTPEEAAVRLWALVEQTAVSRTPSSITLRPDLA